MSASAATAHDAIAVNRAFARCRQITRQRARNFHYGIRLSPEPQRSAIYAVYAWMRLADDLVDSCDASNLSELERRIADFRSHTDAALEGHPTADDPLWLAIAETARQFHLPPEHFHHMLDGQLEDARRTSYETFDQLLDATSPRTMTSGACICRARILIALA
jgi:phytoene synthase